jgi:hypothetical protein
MIKYFHEKNVYPGDFLSEPVNVKSTTVSDKFNTLIVNDS